MIMPLWLGIYLFFSVVFMVWLVVWDYRNRHGYPWYDPAIMGLPVINIWTVISIIWVQCIIALDAYRARKKT